MSALKTITPDMMMDFLFLLLFVSPESDVVHSADIINNNNALFCSSFLEWKVIRAFLSARVEWEISKGGICRHLVMAEKIRNWEV